MVTLTELGTALHSECERVYELTDAAAGLQAFVAIHSTARGPAIGGCRMRPHATRRAALREALRLAKAMSRKAALAQVPFGGGACVVMGDPGRAKTTALLLALAEGIDRLGGAFVAASDSGIPVQDMDILRRVTAHARGVPLVTGEACPAAALGVYMAIEAAVRFRFGRQGLRGRRVAVAGLGTLGMALCDQLAKAGAELLVADIRPDPVAEAVRSFGATAVPVDRILSVPADVLSPNAHGDVICEATLPRIRAAIIAGGADAQLRAPHHAEALHRRGILHVPDVVASAGGLIDLAMAEPDHDPARVLMRCEMIYHTTLRLLQDAERKEISPARLAGLLATARIDQARAASVPFALRVCA